MKNKKENTPDNPDISVEQAFNPDNEYKPKKDTQNRNWIFTVNNPKLTEQEFYDYLKSVENVKYFTFQREKDSTEHHQSYIEFSAPKKFSTMKNIFSNDKMGVNAHIYPRRGSKREAHDYAKKIGEYAYKAYTKISDNYEFGTFVDHGERTDINDMIEMRKNGASHNEIRESYGSYVNFYKRVNFFANESRNELFKTTFRKMENTYIFGDSEQGKSRYATDLYGFKGVYENSGYIKRGWFDDYDYQDVLLLDEYKGQWNIEYLLRVLDGRPWIVDCRFQPKQACYTKVFMTSNKSLNTLYMETQENDPKTWQALMNRIHYVWHIGVQVEPQLNPYNIKTPKPAQLSLVTDTSLIKSFS